MREYNETFKFNKGLSSIGTRRNSDELTKCYNILPRSNGLRGYEPLTNPLGATPVVAIDWPFPQLFCGKKYNYLCERDKVHTLDGSFVLVRTKSVTAGGVWSFADYQDWGVLGNGVENYTISSNGTLTIDPVLTPTLYLARVFCDYKGQLVWGDVNNVSGNFLYWGGIGEKQIDREVTSGFMPMPWRGDILAVKRLEDWLVVYSQHGISILEAVNQPIVGFKLVEFQNIGIGNTLAVGGDKNEHCFLDVDGRIWKLDKSGFKFLDYEETLSGLTGTIVVSCDRSNRDYFFSNGTKCFVLTTEGLGEVFQRPTSVEFYSGGRIGIFSSASDTSLRVETDRLDFVYRGRKALEFIEISGKCSTRFNVYSYFENNATATPTIPCNPFGVGRLKVSANELKIGVHATSYVGAELDFMNIRYKLDDKRFSRGPYAGQTVAGTDK